MLDRFSRYILDPRHRRIIHLSFWAAWFVLKLYLTLITFNVYSSLPFGILFLLDLNSTLLTAGTFYLLTGILWAQLQKGQLLRFAFSFIALLSAFTVLEAVAELALLRSCSGCLPGVQKTQPPYHALLQSGLVNMILKRLLSLGAPFGLLLTLTIPLSLKLAVNAWRSQIKSLQLAKDNLELEFNYLKAQLNPHFLFNSMNNIYGLILQGDQERSAALVSRLSEMLRYMLYESNETLMPLESEIRFLQNYTELEKVRVNEINVSLHIEVDSAIYELPPLLLMPLVENAFKFSPDVKGAYICFFLDISDGRLRFTAENLMGKAERTQPNGGIGLSNLKKRLEMFYPGQYWYEDSISENIYSAMLTIELI